MKKDSQQSINRDGLLAKEQDLHKSVLLSKIDELREECEYLTSRIEMLRSDLIKIQHENKWLEERISLAEDDNRWLELRTAKLETLNEILANKLSDSRKLM